MATKSFIKTIGSKGLLSDYSTEGKKLQTELTAGDRITIDGSTISADRQVFRAIYGTTTYDEIKAAYDAGKAVYCDNHIIRAVTDNTIVFVKNQINNGNASIDEYYLYRSNNNWQKSSNIICQNKLTFDTNPTKGSNNPVTSDGIANIIGYKKLFTQGNSSSTASDNSILFYIKWKSQTDSGIYNRQYVIYYNNYRTGNTGEISISPNITTSTGGNIKLVSDRFNFNDLNFGVIEAPDGDTLHPYWFVCYGYGVGGSIENAGSYTSDIDRLVVVPNEKILTSSCKFTNIYSNTPIYFKSILYPQTTGTFVLKSVDGVIQWVSE